MLKKVNIQKVFGWLVFTSLILLFAVIISPALSIPGVPRTHVVITGSMEPAISVGSLVFTQEVDAKSLKVSDIIAFTSPDDPKGTIIHRIHSIKSTDPLRFETKGDNNNAPDNWDVVVVGVIGKHLFSIPYLGHPAAFIRTPLGFAIMIGLPALIFIISQIINIKKAIKEEIKKEVSKKTTKSKSIFPTIFISLFLVSFFASAKIAQATYADTIIITGLSLSIADLPEDTTPPVTQITTNLYLQTQTNFDIAFTIIDDNPAYVDLCHSYNLGNWSCQNVGLISPYGFSASQGNAVYCFATIGHDTSGNIESKILPNPPSINPLDPNLYCTQFISP